MKETKKFRKMYSKFLESKISVVVIFGLTAIISVIFSINIISWGNDIEFFNYPEKEYIQLENELKSNLQDIDNNIEKKYADVSEFYSKSESKDTFYDKIEVEVDRSNDSKKVKISMHKNMEKRIFGGIEITAEYKDNNINEVKISQGQDEIMYKIVYVILCILAIVIFACFTFLILGGLALLIEKIADR